MKTFILLCLFIATIPLMAQTPMFMGSQHPVYTNGYFYSRVITIDHTKVPNTDQTNFPILVSGTYAYLKTDANGGMVRNANGYDIIFTSDAKGQTKLDHEIETYSATTGAINFWVRIGTLSHTTDNVIYMWYGNPAISTSQQNINGTWNSNFKGVYHLPNGTTLTANDSTSTPDNGTLSGSPQPTPTPGQIDGGALFNGSTAYIDLGTVSKFNLTGTYTLEAWVNIPNTTTTTSGLYVMGDTDTSGAVIQWVFGFNKTAVGGGKFYNLYDGTHPGLANNTALTAGVWYHMAITKAGSSGNWDYTWYQNGAADGTAHTAINPNAQQGAAIGRPGVFNGLYSNAQQDEIRISDTARGADWFATEYNNQSSPSTFYSVSGQIIH